MRRPVVEERWDSEQDTFTVEELAGQLGPFFVARKPGEGFSAIEVLSMRRP
jgi:3-oxoacyl-[acyl-carrier protein] reductase